MIKLQEYVSLVNSRNRVERSVEILITQGSTKRLLAGTQGCHLIKSLPVFWCSNQCELFQVRLVIAEKALKCEEHDVSLPLSEQ